MDERQFGSFEPPFRLSVQETRIIGLAQNGRTKAEIATATRLTDAVVRQTLRNVAEKIRLFADG